MAVFVYADVVLLFATAVLLEVRSRRRVRPARAEQTPPVRYLTERNTR